MKKAKPQRNVRSKAFVCLLLIVCSWSMLAASEWQPGAGYRSRELPVPKTGKPGFTMLTAAETGITFSNTVPEQVHLTNHIFLDGSGVALGDVDGDGLCDGRHLPGFDKTKTLLLAEIAEAEVQENVAGEDPQQRGERGLPEQRVPVYQKLKNEDWQQSTRA